MRYYITGANGFIGKNLVKFLDGQDVTPISNPVYFHFAPADRWKPFTFIHLSAYGNHYHQTDNRTLIKANIEDLQDIIELLKQASCDKFFNISSSAIQLPNQTLYSVSKHFGELLVESCKRENYYNVRPYSVYGPGEADHRFIPTVIRALETGETIDLDENAYHDWIHVDDFIQAMFEGHTNIGTGKSFQNLDIVFMLEDIAKKKLNYNRKKLRSYDTKDWICPKGVPHRPIYEGLKQTYEHFTQKNFRDKQKA